MTIAQQSKELSEKGFTTIPAVLSGQEVQQLEEIINDLAPSSDTFRKSAGLFAIRQFLKEAPKAGLVLFNSRLPEIIGNLFGSHYFIIKSIYFDKPAQSNWFVPYHQDLTISVNQKADHDGFGPWTVKQNQFGVQPPTQILQNNFTIRIHLDDTDKSNGALKVIPGSHRNLLHTPAEIAMAVSNEYCCDVPAGGIMIMKPLLLHASSRTTNNNRRRVIHIEFGSDELPNGLGWSEYCDYRKLSNKVLTVN